MTNSIINNLVKSPEGCFKQNVIDGYGLSKVEADVLWDYVNNFVKEHYLACRFDKQIIFYAVSTDEPAGKPIKDCRLIPVKLTLYRHTDRKIKAKLGKACLSIMSLRATRGSVAISFYAIPTYWPISKLMNWRINIWTQKHY
ncbi:MAG TPA: hypothetical protein DEG96_02335 [Candidatus Atribacteria bacterium]|nr:hypothetical protein [Candidatus Atribacteria bacterium]